MGRPALASSLLLLLIAATSALAQEAKVVEPEYVGVPFRLDSSDGQPALLPLERQSFVMATKGKFWSFGAKATYDIPGKSSPIRFKSGEPLHFVIRMASQDVDPQQSLRLVPLEAGEPKKKQRKAGITGIRKVQALDASTGWMGGTVDMSMGALVILVKPHGESSFDIKPEMELPPGEYALVNVGANTAFCFGLD